MSAISRLWAAFRFDEWWYSKAAAATAVALSLALATGPDFAIAIRTTLLGVIAIVAIAAFGYGVNDVADAEADRRSGKRRAAPLAEVRARRGLLLLALLIPIGMAAAWVLGTGAMTVAAVGFVLAAAYSLPPVRLKERGLVGAVAAGSVERIGPTALYLAAFTEGDTSSSVLLFVGLLLWSGLAGVRGTLVHQILDATNDRHAELRTWVTIRGEEGLRQIIGRIVFPAETAAFAIVIAALIDISGWVALGLAPAVLSWFHLDPNRHPRWLGDRKLALADRVYRIWWPLAVAGALVMHDPRFLAAAGGYLLLFQADRWWRTFAEQSHHCVAQQRAGAADEKAALS